MSQRLEPGGKNNHFFTNSHSHASTLVKECKFGAPQVFFKFTWTFIWCYSLVELNVNGGTLSFGGSTTQVWCLFTWGSDWYSADNSCYSIPNENLKCIFSFKNPWPKKGHKKVQKSWDFQVKLLFWNIDIYEKINKSGVFIPPLAVDAAHVISIREEHLSSIWLLAFVFPLHLERQPQSFLLRGNRYAITRQRDAVPGAERTGARG